MSDIIFRIARILSQAIILNMILGLKRGRVQLVEHQAGWKDAFASESRLLTSLLGETVLCIEHVGSTAVPGLVAKPVLDLAIAVSSLDNTISWPERLNRAGYEFFGDRENWNEHFYAKGPDHCRTIYLHVVPIDSQRWLNYIRFRNLLRTDAGLREVYARTKREAAEAHAIDRTAYTTAKEQIIREILTSPRRSS